MNIFDLIPGNSAKLSSMKGLLLGVSMIAVGNAASGQTLLTNNGALIAVTTGATVIVKNASAHNATGLISNQGSITIEQNLVNDDSMSGGGTRGLYRVHDNWVNNATFIHDSTNVELYGDNQLVTGTAVTTFYDLTLTGTGIKTQTLDANLVDTLALNDRELATDVFRMHILNTNPGVITKTAGNNGFVSSLGVGRLVWDLDRNAPYFFPTGSSVGVARYRPVGIRPNNPTSIQTIEIRLANNDATVDGFDRSQKDSNICLINDKFYHLVGRSAGAEPAQVTFYYDTIADGLWYILTNWQATKWSDVGNTAPGPGFAPPFSALAKANWNGFSNEPFALGRPNPGIDSTLTLISNLHCFNDSTGAISVTLSNGTPPLNFNWNTGDTTLSLSHASAGSDILTISDQAGCSRSFGPFVITQPPQILLSDTVGNIKCNGDQNAFLTVNVSSAVLPVSSYHWSVTADSTSNTLSNIGAGTYSVTVYDANRCQNKLTETISQPDAISATDNTHELNCFKSGDGSIALTVTGGTTGNPLYHYQWSDSSTIDTSVRTGLMAGTYGVTITDRNGCKDSTTIVTVTQPDSLSLLASADTTIAIGYSAQLEVLSTNGGTGSLSYSWTPTTGLSNPTGSTTTATPVQTTTYTVTGTDANGCKVDDTIRVRVDSNLVTVPDGFIPDGNNPINRTFHLLTSVTVEVVELKIFNRWGQLISSSTNGWDGTYNGRPQPMDTYVYQATIRLPNGSNMQKSGDFILIR